jgi:hypothetical protein
VGAGENAIDKISGVHYFNLPTDQIPQDSTIQKFLSIMDDKNNYPVLIHCHHGVGPSRLFSSIYRIEYENFSNEDARANARLFWELSSNFSKSSQKGKFLINYKKRVWDIIMGSNSKLFSCCIIIVLFINIFIIYKNLTLTNFY